MKAEPVKNKAVGITAADLLFDITGGFLASLGTQCFSAPNNIAPGGVSGISIMVNYLTGLPISMMVMIINIPLLILAWFFLGRRSTARTVKSVAVLTLMLQLTDMLISGGMLPAYRGDSILAALYGGVLSGTGLGLVFMRGSTSGGTDIVARLIQLKVPSVSVGRLLLVADGCVLLAAAAVYRNVENALFAMISIFVSTRLIDSMLYGLDMGKVLMIVSERHSMVAKQIGEELERGCTMLEGRGAYTNQDRPVLLCAVRKNQVFDVKRIVFDIDPAAFIMAMEANEIIGNGFRPAEGTGR